MALNHSFADCLSSNRKLVRQTAAAGFAVLLETAFLPQNLSISKWSAAAHAGASLLKQWGLLAALTGILVFLAAYSYVIIYLRSGNQSLAVHIDDEWLKEQGGQLTLTVDGNEHTITAPRANGESLSITVSLGEHEFAVKHGDTYVHNPRDFEIRKDGKVILQITQDDMRLVSTPDRTPEDTTLSSSEDSSGSGRNNQGASSSNNRLGVSREQGQLRAPMIRLNPRSGGTSLTAPQRPAGKLWARSKYGTMNWWLLRKAMQSPRISFRMWRLKLSGESIQKAIVGSTIAKTRQPQGWAMSIRLLIRNRQRSKTILNSPEPSTESQADCQESAASV